MSWYLVCSEDTRNEVFNKQLFADSDRNLEEGVPVLIPTTYENEDGETVHADAEVIVEPGTTGFVREFVDELSSPFDCYSEALADLPVYSQK
jgi:hypothetical protein